MQFLKWIKTIGSQMSVEHTKNICTARFFRDWWCDKLFFEEEEKNNVLIYWNTEARKNYHVMNNFTSIIMQPKFLMVSWVDKKSLWNILLIQNRCIFYHHLWRMHQRLYIVVWFLYFLSSSNILIIYMFSTL